MTSDQATQHRLRLNLLATWGDHLTTIAIGLFLMPWVLGVVGDDNYGAWLFMCSIAGYTGLCNLGFGETVSRYVAHHHAKGETHKINEVTTAVGGVYLLMGTMIMTVAGLLAAVAPGLYDWNGATPSEVRTVILLLAGNVVVGMLGSVAGGVIVGLQRFDIERGFRVVASFVRLGLTVWFLRQGPPLVTLAAVHLCGTVLENALYLTVVFRQMPGFRPGWRSFRLETLRECFAFSLFTLLDNVAGRIIDATHTIIIGITFGSRYIVPYYVAHRMMTFIVQPLHMIGHVLMPRGAELGAIERDDRLRLLVSKGLTVSLLLIGSFYIGALFFGEAALTAWVGRHYDGSHAILVVLLGAQIVATPMRVLRGVLFGMGHVRVPAILYFIEALANIALTLILMRPLGLTGVALGTAIPVLVIELGLTIPYALRTLKFPVRDFMNSIVVPLALPLAALWGYSAVVAHFFHIPGTWGPVLLVAAGGGAVLAASGYAVWKGRVASPELRVASGE